MKPLQTWLANYCERHLVELSLLYLAFFKTILAALFRTISLPLPFCLQNLHFSMTISPPKIRIFPVFQQYISTDKAVNRSKHAYALRFCVNRFFRSRYSQKKQGRSLNTSGYKIQKICGGKMYSHTRTLGAEVHKSKIEV